ncbi:hypothetical protein A2U01_0025720 [Trifolium medium]|uniref:Uncharacterized protein n=1 Tax=Trifolium medium TaxID=97028 RepID=A0A392NY04_9FABA|nr:hypothetical protein [Trifolium medium]
MGIRNDIDKLSAKRRTLVRFQDTRKKLDEEEVKLTKDLEVAAKCKDALENMQRDAIEAANDLDYTVVP